MQSVSNVLSHPKSFSQVSKGQHLQTGQLNIEPKNLGAERGTPHFARQFPVKALLISAFLMILSPFVQLGNAAAVSKGNVTAEIETPLDDSATDCTGVNSPLTLLENLDKMTVDEKMQVFNHAKLPANTNHKCPLEDQYPVLSGQNYRHIVRLMKLTASPGNGYVFGFNQLCTKMGWSKNLTCLTVEQLAAAENF